MASSSRALSFILLCTNQECRGEAGGVFRGKEQFQSTAAASGGETTNMFLINKQEQ